LFPPLPPGTTVNNYSGVPGVADDAAAAADAAIERVKRAKEEDAARFAALNLDEALRDA